MMRSLQYNPNIRSQSVIDRHANSRTSSANSTPQQVRAYHARMTPPDRRPTDQMTKYSKNNGHLRNHSNHIDEVR